MEAFALTKASKDVIVFVGDQWWEDWTRINLQIRANYQMPGNWKSRVLSEPNISEGLGPGFEVKDYAAYLQLLKGNAMIILMSIG